MSIWEYSAQRGWTDSFDIALNQRCIYCNTPLERDAEDEEKVVIHETVNYGVSDKFTTSALAMIGICPACGWWKYGLSVAVGGKEPYRFEYRIGSLKKLDVSDMSTPIEEVRSYLVANYEARFNVNPRRFEEVVASVYSDHGFDARATAYSGDGGIDVILGNGDSTIGVQVKRYRNKISVSQIRELVGALVVEGHTKGIFVTTSEYQSGAFKTAASSSEKGFPIELIDAHGFLESLKIAQLEGTREVAARKPWGSVREWS